jgi:hypothetical protein
VDVRLHAEMSFPDMESLLEAKFPLLQVHMVTPEQEKENRRAFLPIRAHEDDKEEI